MNSTHWKPKPEGFFTSSTSVGQPFKGPLLPLLKSSTASPWSTGLYDCFDDVGNCCMTSLVPTCYFRPNFDRESTSCGKKVVLYLTSKPSMRWRHFSSNRSKMREQYRLEESPCSDARVRFNCASCALCHEYKELKNGGFDMTMGWKADVEKQTRGVTTLPPAVTGGMSRGV